MDGVNKGRRPEAKNPHGTNKQTPHTGDLTGPNSKEAIPWKELQEALRRVIVCCGDWRRVCTYTVLGYTHGEIERGTTALFLDPPYKKYGRVYGVNYKEIADEVRRFGIVAGEDPDVRVLLCGFSGEHQMPAGWTCYRWTRDRGMNRTTDTAGRERIWASPGALAPTDLEVLVRVDD
jgi:hypothetical protein